MNGLFQDKAVVFFFMAHTKTLALAQTIEWDNIGQWAKDDILQGLTGNKQFMASESEREQCFHACCILRIGQIPAAPYSVIGRLPSLNKDLVR
jgi:hypothetical protein